MDTALDRGLGTQGSNGFGPCTCLPEKTSWEVLLVGLLLDDRQYPPESLLSLSSTVPLSPSCYRKPKDREEPIPVLPQALEDC